MQKQNESGPNLQASLQERERLATLYGDVGLALTRSGSLRDVLQACSEALVRNVEAAFARIWTLNAQTNMLELEASAGLYTHLDGPHSRVPVGQFKIGLIAAERKPHLTNSVSNDPRVSDPEWARREGMVAFAGYPLIVEDRLVGVLALFARHALSRVLLQALETVAYGTALLIKQKRDEEALRASEKRKTAILETALDCIITIDHDGTVLEFNPAAERTFGYSREQALGRQMLELIIPKELRERHARDVEDYLASAAPQFARRFETTAMRANGSEFPVELAVVRITLDGSDLYTVFLRDITERREAEQQRERLLAAAEAAQRSYRQMAEAMPQQVWTAQPDGTLDYLNQRGLDYFRRSSAELLSAGWLAVVHPADANEAAERWRRSLQTGEPYEVEFRLAEGGTGQYSWHLGRAVAIRDNGGAIVRWIGTNTDIQDRKKVEEDLQEAKANADFANQAKSQFLASMSHELRTPLNAVIGYSEMLQEEATERGLTDLVPDLKKIHRAGSYLLNLINNVLDLSKIEAGKMELFLETFDVSGMLDDVATTVEPLIVRNGNRLEVACAPDAGALHSDLTKVRQCLLNLLSNAAKFTDHGSIRLEAARAGDVVTLRVSDTGIGLSPAQMQKLFDPFMQFHSGRETHREGTGLGLAITRRLCQMLGGEITLASEVGKGSAFTITLPARAPLPAEEPVAPEPVQAECSAGDIVLTVDDDPGSRELMARFLRKEGFRPVAAENGEEALRLARELRPRLITLDVMMPGMDGWAVLTALKTDSEVADIPVIMVSVVDNKNLGFALGATDYLTKPIDRKRLAQLLERYCRRELPGPVLLVEDDEVSRAMVRKAVKEAGWQLIEAADGTAALRLMEQQTPALILLDLLMPNMDGFEFAWAVRQDARWRSIPIIVSTSKELNAADRARLAGHVESVLAKGAYTHDELRRQIRELAARR